MFNSFVAFISFSLQMQLSKRWPYKHGMSAFWNSLQKNPVILKQPFPCSWYFVTFWMLNRMQDHVNVLKWYKWDNSWRKRVEFTWPFFYDLITIREKNLHYVQHVILPQQTMAACPNLFYLKQVQLCGFKVFRCKDLSFQNYLYIYI